MDIWAINRRIGTTALSLCLAVLLGCSTIGEKLTNQSQTQEPSVTAVTITPQNPNLFISLETQLAASETLSDGTKVTLPSLVWSSSKPSVAVVSPNGIVQCTAQGSAIINAQAGNVGGSTLVSCLSATVTALTLRNTPDYIHSDAPFKYTVIATYSDGSTGDVTANATISADPAIAAIAGDGTVLCNHPGQSAIAFGYGGATVSSAFTCVIRSMPQHVGFVESAETFEGPFNSWVNLKTAFGAAGDGLTDDTAAFQAALDAIHEKPAVLWIPRGTYVITKPLRLAGTANTTILGENPLTTTLQWEGSPGATLITFQGCMGLNFGRLSLDGSSQAAELLELTWDDVSNYYPTRNFIHDSRFLNVGTGVHTGWAGETTIDRVHFDHNTVAGISLGDFNALNFNIVDSLFTNNAIGVTNSYGAGAFNISNSVFQGSTQSDISIGNTGPFSFRNNLSVGSRRFLQTAMTGAPASILIQNNVIYNPITDPLYIGNPGSLSLIDNNFVHLASGLHLLVGGAASPLTFMALGNTYAVSEPYAGYLGKYTALDEAASLSVENVSWVVPSEVYVPQHSGRTVYDLPSSVSASELQATLSGAAQKGGVIHLPAGTYHLAQTLEIANGSNIELDGDGAITDIAASPDLNGPMIKVQSGQVVFRDVQFSSSTSSASQSSVEIDVPDLPSSRVECDECATNATAGSGFSMDGVDQALLVMKVGTMNASGSGFAEVIHGGPLQQGGNTTLGRTNNYMTSMSELQLDEAGSLLVEDGWHDSGQGQTQFTVGDQSRLTVQGGTIYVPSSNAPLGALWGSQGSLNLLSTELNSYVEAASSSQAQIFIGNSIQFSQSSAMSQHGEQESDINDWSAPANASPVALAAAPLTPTIAEAGFATARTQLLPSSKPYQAGSTSIRLSRVVTDGSGIHVAGVPSSSQGDAYELVGASSSGVSQAECSTGTESQLFGPWQLSKDADGSFTLFQSSGTLTEALVANGAALGVIVGPASSARSRWIISPYGDGTYQLFNRATGDALTLTQDGCISASANGGSGEQRWMFDVARP